MVARWIVAIPGTASPGTAISGMIVWLQEAEAKQPFLKALPPMTRAKVLSALAGLIILGFLLVVLAWMGARATRKYMNIGAPEGETPGERATRLVEDDWIKRTVDHEIGDKNENEQ